MIALRIRIDLNAGSDVVSVWLNAWNGAEKCAVVEEWDLMDPGADWVKS
jgi:hypothetical protein